MNFVIFNLMAGLIAGLYCGVLDMLARRNEDEVYKPQMSLLIGVVCGAAMAALLPVYGIQDFLWCILCVAFLERSIATLARRRTGGFDFGQCAALAGVPTGFEMGSYSTECDYVPGLEADHVMVRISLAGTVQSDAQRACLRSALAEAGAESNEAWDRLP